MFRVMGLEFYTYIQNNHYENVHQIIYMHIVPSSFLMTYYDKIWYLKSV